MSEAIRVERRESQGERCALCHDAIGVEPSVCAGCGTFAHTGCRDSLGWCPTIGCRFGRGGVSGVPVGVRVRARVGPRPPAWWLVVGLFALSLFLFESVLVNELVRANYARYITSPDQWRTLGSLTVVEVLFGVVHFFILPAWIALRSRGREAAVFVAFSQALIAFFVALVAPDGGPALDSYLSLQAVEPIIVALVVRAGCEDER